jgi:hypothetical protein
VTAAPLPRTPLQTGWGHIGATLGAQTITSERTTPDANGSASFQHTDQTWPSAPGRQRGVAAARSAAWPHPTRLVRQATDCPPASLHASGAGLRAPLAACSAGHSRGHSTGHNCNQLERTGRESQPSLSWLDPTGTSSAEYRQLSPKQLSSNGLGAAAASRRRTSERSVMVEPTASSSWTTGPKPASSRRPSPGPGQPAGLTCCARGARLGRSLL